MFRSPRAIALFFGTTIVGMAIDLWTKSLAATKLRHGGSVDVVTDWLQFKYTENFGAVFGLGQGQRPLFIIVSIGAIAFLTYLFAVSGRRPFYQFLLGLLLAGVLGNMYDRIVYGYVRDMILALPGITWPAGIARHLPADLADKSVFPWIFNVADSMLCSGVFLMVVYSLFHKPADPTIDSASDSPNPSSADKKDLKSPA